MKLVYVFLFIISFTGYSQEFRLQTILDEQVKESSGLVFLNNKIITHNDSGNTTDLFEMDPVSGIITRTVNISNTINIDWEDITSDDAYMYIGDFGNVSGSRTDLKIYRIAISEYINTANNIVTADVINYSYSDQMDFSSNMFNTNYDAEALIAYENDLYIFTKNWVDNTTNIYSIPKIPGTYSVDRIDSLDAEGLITGASYNSISDMIVLTGYNLSDAAAFIIELKDFTFDFFSNGIINRYEVNIPDGYSIQIESITFFNENQYYVTAEESLNNNSGLYILTSTDNTLEIKSNTEEKNIIFPNPASSSINIDAQFFFSAEIYDLKGTIHKFSTQSQIDLSDLASGVYLIALRKTKDSQPVFERLIIN